MAKKQAVRDPEAPSGPTTEGQEGSGSSAPAKDKPIHEVRIGRVKAVIWANRTENGTRHNITLRSIFKRNSNAQWVQSDSFGRDDLPLVMEVSRQAWLWIFDHAQG